MNKPVKNYAEYVEFGAMRQFVSAMKQDFSVQGALMPDAHRGYTLPIGSVIATQDFILPSWVGYDIGCGMCAQAIDVSREEIVDNAQEIYDEILRTIPVGFNINKTGSYESTDLHIKDLSEESHAIAFKKNWMNALGTLGGGNHFIEIGADENDLVCIVIHSGSRGVGHGIAQHYMKLASPTGKASEGHFGFRTGSLEGEAYINDLLWVQQYALDNRKEMMNRVMAAVRKVTGNPADDILFRLINRNHNHAELRKVPLATWHSGIEWKELWIHRKGATHAEDGMLGVIPGNMRDGSFIVRGKGNPDSLYSSSHGAGRVLGRKQAKRVLSTDDFKATMKGIVANVSDGTLDESPMAYKDIFKVMEQQADLVDVVSHIKPILNVKG